MVFFIITTGLSGIIAQLVLLREMLVIFYGNELSIGIILANWLITEAFGSYFVGKKIEHLKPLSYLPLLTITVMIFALSLPLSVYLVRILKLLLNLPFGQGVGVIPIFWASLLFLAPVSITHGALFTFSCKLFAEKIKSDSQAIARVYRFETIGTLLGGVIFTYLLIPFLNSFQIVSLVMVLNFLLVAVLSFILPFASPLIKIKRIAFTTFSFAIVSLILSLFFTKKIEKINEYSIRKQWANQNVVYNHNSIYGNISVIRQEEQYTFFHNGIPILTTPTPDIAGTEDFVHFPMLAHPSPKNVLVISGGAGGVIQEILKHNVAKIDYLELDPSLLSAIKKFPTPLTEKELSSPNVFIHHIDGRLFLKKRDEQYDIIFLGLKEPSDLAINRLFTKEFFALVIKNLNKGGIFVFALPGSLTYLPIELKKLNRSILNTLKSVFPYVAVIPGDYNLFLATKEELKTLEPKTLWREFVQRNIQSKIFTPSYLEYRLHQRWLDWFYSELAIQNVKANIDFVPSAMLYSIAYWNSFFVPQLRKLFIAIEKVKLEWILGLIALFLITILLRKNRLTKKFSLVFLIAATGFYGMLFSLILSFAFQITYGYVYYQIGLLVTAFMVGIAIGSLLATKVLAKGREPVNFIILIEIILILFPLLFLLGTKIDAGALKFPPALFPFFSLFLGTLIGMVFPLAASVYLKERRGVSLTAGSLYASDLFGGFIGGILGSSFLLPVLGLVSTIIIIITLKGVTMLTLIIARQRF